MMVTHDHRAVAYADRVVRIADGTLAADDADDADGPQMTQMTQTGRR
ncbi:MAG: hypothetical protein R2712_29545 [Vicinamibacterales bacterium]